MNEVQIQNAVAGVNSVSGSKQKQQQGRVDGVNQRTGFKAKPVADRGEIDRVGIESLAHCQRGVVVADEIEPMSQRGQGE